MFFKNTLRGFSLVELLVYITIFSIVSASIWQAFIWFQKNHINFTEQQKISFDIDHLYDLLNKDISSADPIILNYSKMLDENGSEILDESGAVKRDKNCLDIGNIKYYISFDNASQKGTLYRSASCSLGKEILRNIKLSKNLFFYEIAGNANYKTISYAFEIDSNNKVCCGTDRTIFSSLKK